MNWTRPDPEGFELALQVDVSPLFARLQIILKVLESGSEVPWVDPSLLGVKRHHSLAWDSRSELSDCDANRSGINIPRDCARDKKEMLLH